MKQKKITDAEWLVLVEELIAKHSTPPRKTGKYKGHGSTDSAAWIAELTSFCWGYIKRTHRDQAYDENMALAALLADDAVMGRVWKHQEFNLPFGKGARGGKFV